MGIASNSGRAEEARCGSEESGAGPVTGEQVTLVLLGFGLAGGIANFAAGRTVRHHVRATMFAAGALVGTGALLVTLANGERIVAVLLVLVWGAGFGAVPVAAQMWMAQTMHEAVGGGLALFVSALQGSLAAGCSAVGGLLYNTYGTVGALLTATIVAGLGGAAVGSRTAAVDRLDVVGGPAEASSPNAVTFRLQAAEPGLSGPARSTARCLDRRRSGLNWENAVRSTR
jgi:MFS family permease